MLDATVRKWDSPTTPEYVTNFTWTAEVRSSPRLGNPWGSENLPERIPTNPSRAVPGFDAAIHRLQGGCLLSGDRGSDLRDDVSETPYNKLACAGTSDGESVFKGRDPGRSWEIAVTSSDLVSAPSVWIATITLQDGPLDLNRGRKAKPAVRPPIACDYR